MKTIKREYFAKVPLINGLEDDYFWSALDAKTLTTAQHKCNVNGCMSEIAIRGGTGFKVISKKNAKGKWEVVYEGGPDEQERLASEQTQYHQNGKLVSRSDFYKLGFQHEKLSVAEHH